MLGRQNKRNFGYDRQQQQHDLENSNYFYCSCDGCTSGPKEPDYASCQGTPGKWYFPSCR